jgi:hypothetical protein
MGSRTETRGCTSATVVRRDLGDDVGKSGLEMPGKVSKEEMLMWEGMRCVAWGITHFEVQSGKFVFLAVPTHRLGLWPSSSALIEAGKTRIKCLILIISTL